MDKLIEMHNIGNCFECGGGGIEVDHANITKEVACGFLNWFSFNTTFVVSGDDKYYNLETAEFITEIELFDIYIKSL